MPSTIVLLNLDEPAGVHPSDRTGNLDDLHPVPETAAPDRVQTWAGYGRRFVRASNHGLVAADITGQDTFLLRDVTIMALLSLTLTGAAGPHVIYARGLNDGTTAERYSVGLEVAEQTGNAGYVEVRLFWQNSAGAIIKAPPGVFQHPGDGKEFKLTASRRWERTDRVVVRYYVAGTMIAELVTEDGDISGGTTGHTTLGFRFEDGDFEDGLNGTIDKLAVLDHEVAPREVLHLWRRLSDFQPGGVDTIYQLQPPGLEIKNPASAIGKLAKVQGLAVGLIAAQTEEMRTMWIPPNCPHGHIEKWEELTGQAPKPRDSLETRNARVLAYGQREQGYAPPQIQRALAELLDTAPANLDIENFEFGNEFVEAFTTLDLDHRWAKGPVGTWGVVAGELEHHVDSAEVVDPDALPRDAGADLWTSIDQGKREAVNTDTDYTAFVAAKFVSWDFPLITGTGIYLENRVTRNLLWFGVYRDIASVMRIGYRTRLDGVLGAFTSVALAPVSGPLWLRMQAKPDPDDPTVTFSYSVTGQFAGFTHVDVELDNANRIYEWAGLRTISTDDTPLAGDVDVTLDNFVTFCPFGELPFHWYVYRDPDLLGEPDLVSAQAVLRSAKPAHTYTSLIVSPHIVLGDPLMGLVGRGPI